jgi:molybdate transport system regulatory protein
LHYGVQLYLNASGKRVFDNKGAAILETIDKQGSITATAINLKMSYRFVWGYISLMQKALKGKIIVTHRGGTHGENGGGGATLTPLARRLLREFRSKEILLERDINK